MNGTDIILLALALSVDAFVAAFSYGLVIRKRPFVNALKLAAATGIGQFVMPVIGWLGTKSVHVYIEAFDHWIAFLVFLALGLNIIGNALTPQKEDDGKESCLNFKTLLMIGIATSIDACVAGVTLYFTNVSIWTAAALIGLITFINTVIGFRLSCCLQKLPTKYLEIGAGIVLILLGAKVLIEHLSA